MAVHGLAPRPPHVNACDECRATVARLEAELKILRRADARLIPPHRSTSRTPAMLLAAAASVLIGILGAIVFWPAPSPTAPPVQPAQDNAHKPEPTVDELVKGLLEGREGSAAKIREHGEAALVPLAEARLREKDAKGRTALLALYGELKVRSWHADENPDILAVVNKLNTTKLSLSMTATPLAEIIGFIRDFTGMNISVDPPLEAAGKMDLELKNSTLRDILELVTQHFEADFDLRYGAIWIAAPSRLWVRPEPEKPVAPLTVQQTKSARAWLTQLRSDVADERAQAAAALFTLGRGVSGLLHEGARDKDADFAAQCRGIAEKLRPRERTAALGVAQAWRKQALAGVDKDVADKLVAIRMTLDMQNAPLPDVIAYIRDVSGLNYVIDTKTLPAPDEVVVTLKLTDLPLAQLLEAITLPRGLDARIESGVIVISRTEK